MVLSKETTNYNDLDNPHTLINSEKWQKDVRPPYEEWGMTNGGVNRIAFSTQLPVTPENSEIVEF